MVKKITVNDRKMKELEGFEDVLDLLTDEKTVATRESKAQSEDSYELYSFLENENLRLLKNEEKKTLVAEKSFMPGESQPRKWRSPPSRITDIWVW